ncbi:MAG: TlpA disulfide reductase family protein [bacterium]|nr:TlpA disulfide reductase family protein [bacterium]
MTDSPTPGATKPRFSPALLIFLVFPVFGIAAAAALILTESAGRTPAAVSAPATPRPVEVPTLVNVVDAPMIDFELPTPAGSTLSLSDFAGRIVFLNFWATWCEPCKRELPAFARFTADNPAPDDPVILAVNYGENAEIVDAYLAENGLSGLTILLDPAGSVADDYGVFQLPVTFVIDPNGIVRYPKYGEVTLEELNGYVEAVQAAS